MKTLSLVSALCVVAMAFGFAETVPKVVPSSSSINAHVILSDMAESYSGEVPEEMAFEAQFSIDPGDEHWVIEVGDGQAKLGRGPDTSAQFVFSLSLETLHSIYNGEMTAMTAGGKGSGADSAPLEFEFTEAAMELADPKGVAFHFLQHFFNRAEPEKILLGEEHSRVVHGANVCALYYAPGFRSAWYMVEKGQRLNEPGDTDPFPQAFVIISGEGLGKIGEETIEIRGGESYYVPPGSDHVIWTEGEEPLVLIWFGWGEGA
jgi:mannose-6-phosphate isomerase-like protein (cupin superfamily)